MSYVKTSGAGRARTRKTHNSSGGLAEAIGYLLAIAVIVAAVALVAAVLAVIWILCLISAGVLAIFPKGRVRAKGIISTARRVTVSILRLKRQQPQAVSQVV
jgi:hypothetical protein